MEPFAVRCRSMFKIYGWRLIMVMGVVGCVVLVSWSFIVFHGSVSSSLSTAVTTLAVLETRSNGGEISLPKSIRVGEFSLLNDSAKTEKSSVVLALGKSVEISQFGREIEDGDEITLEKDGDPVDNFKWKKDFPFGKDKRPTDDSELEKDRDPNEDFSLEDDQHPDDDFLIKKDRDQDDDFALKEHQDPYDGFSAERALGMGHDFTLQMVSNQSEGFTLAKYRDQENGFPLENVRKPMDGSALDDVGKGADVLTPDKSWTALQKLGANSSDLSKNGSSGVSFTGGQATTTLPKIDYLGPTQSSFVSLNGSSTKASVPIVRKKRKISPLNISEMNRLLLWRRVSSHPTKTRWSSVRDKELLSAKKQIENAHILKEDKQLYAPAFRNVSMFKRSYELMEHRLKVYVYKEGERPIFHKPLLRGIYASEGWFMKLMEGNKHYVVKDPRKAHLFYLPFSSRLLQLALYVPRSHTHKNLVEYLKNYVEKIAAKYPFWNRTGGADHFLVACHDWASSETRHNMEHSIRALCNADLSKGFNLGRDVSLPETYVRSGQNPLKDIGGEPPPMRPTLAFYAGNMHGELRTILLKYWENKDPDMKIIGPMPPGVESKMTYIHHMKTSKYCICPRGYEVNSPRVVEAIFYECVPVIISDNYVPPFFEVLNWEAFSVFVAEKDIPMLKDILTSITEERYLTMQMAVKKVQQHFLWHVKPLKYDLFHMTLHSIWLNRIHQIRS